jgi:SAM-dependent methyltransferase
MTTAGLLVQEPLDKAQCMSCGLLHRLETRHLGATDFYEKHYSFYERPGAAKYDAPRYAAMAKWIYGVVSASIGIPDRILDAGCGRGWMMKALKEHFSQSQFNGVEPSEQESENARQLGFSVKTGKISSETRTDQAYDLIYSTNVIEHTVDPKDFLASLKRLISDQGLIVIICPDSSVPSAEFMFSDQNYSVSPSHLFRLAETVGLNVVDWQPAPEVPSLKDKQLVVFSKTKGHTLGKSTIKECSPEELYAARAKYVQAYADCDAYLANQTKSYTKVYNFGTSTWSLLLAAYCPTYWSRVTACTIDNGNEEFQGKKVVAFEDIKNEKDSLFILGVNPITQTEFSNRFKNFNLPFVRWDHFVTR